MLTSPTKLQQSTRLSLARIKRGPSLSLPTSPPPLRVLSGLQQRQGLLQADHRRRDALAVEYAVCQISAGMYIHLRPRALLARAGSAKQGRAGHPTSMSDNRPLAVSLSASAGVSLLEVHFDDRCSVGMDPLVDLHEETLEAALPRGGSADGLHPPESAECPFCIAAREWQRGKKFQERLNVRMCLGVASV